MSHLLDVNVLVALATPTHVHHGFATDWLKSITFFSTCAAVQVGFIRVSLSAVVGASYGDALASLLTIVGEPGHSFVTDAISADMLPIVTGHKEVHDAHLVMLAKHHGLKLATFDQALCTKTWAQGIADYAAL